MQRVDSLEKTLDAWGWCTGTTQRDGTGREEGGGFRMGKHVYLWWIHFDIWQNQYNIVKLKKKKKKDPDAGWYLGAGGEGDDRG